MQKSIFNETSRLRFPLSRKKQSVALHECVFVKSVFIVWYLAKAKRILHLDLRVHIIWHQKWPANQFRATIFRRLFHRKGTIRNFARQTKALLQRTFVESILSSRPDQVARSISVDRLQFEVEVARVRKNRGCENKSPRYIHINSNIHFLHIKYIWEFIYIYLGI